MKPGRKKWIITAAIALAIIGAGVLAFIYVPEPLQRWQANRLLNAFRANPCQQTADPLIALLRESRVKQDQGNEILTALLEPKAIPKASYAPGEMIIVDVVSKHDVKVDGLAGDWGGALNVSLPGRDNTDAQFRCISESITLADPLTSSSLNIGTSRITKGLKIAATGNYSGDVRLVYSMVHLTPLDPGFARLARSRQTAWQRLVDLLGLGSKEPFPSLVYKCSFRLPVTIRVATTSPASSPATAGAATKP
jgi:hypothetical protein